MRVLWLFPILTVTHLFVPLQSTFCTVLDSPDNTIGHSNIIEHVRSSPATITGSHCSRDGDCGGGGGGDAHQGCCGRELGSCGGDC